MKYMQEIADLVQRINGSRPTQVPELLRKGLPAAYSAGVTAGKVEAYEDALAGHPSCSREGLCREKWEGPSEYDDCSSCNNRQRLERQAVALKSEKGER